MEFDKKDFYVCPDCKNTGVVREPSGEVHTCWKCLSEGRLDAHSKKLPDTNIRL
jgi:ribosomal protein L37AE/L43A